MNRLLDLPITNILQSQLPRLSSLGSGHTPLRARVLKAKQSHKAGCVEDSTWCPTRFSKKSGGVLYTWVKPRFFLLNNFVCCLAFWFLDVHLFLWVEVDADQELPSVSSFWHYMTSMIHDWNWVKKILWIFEDHLLVSVNNISFQSLFTTCFSYKYTLNWIETLLYLQGISMYKSYKWKMDEAQETTSVYFSTTFGLQWYTDWMVSDAWFDGSTRPPGTDGTGGAQSCAKKKSRIWVEIA